MQTHSRLRAFALIAFTAAVASLGFSVSALADPPSRVARMGYMLGTVSFSPAGEDDWVRAGINRPLTTGDRLWVDGRSRAEMQVGGAVVRMNADTGMTIVNLDDEIAQLQLTQGTLNVRVRHLDTGQQFEIDTPNLAFTLRQPGDYRISVDANGDATTIAVRRGQGEAYGEDASYIIGSGQAYRFTGSRLRDYEFLDVPRADEFDQWAAGRDRSYDNSPSVRYVSQDVIGYQDLDANGTWRNDPTYGNVWFPSRVSSGWAPYRDGHWAWIDPWGWTWVDDAPWGFAVSHYGRWANLRGAWGWVPGPVRTRAYYAPALVAFVGGSNFQLSVSSGRSSGVAWFPLAPREVYRPAYTVSRGYFENINRSNTVVNTTVINNYYNNSNVTNVTYANRQVAGAVIAVPTSTFVQSQPVSKAAVRVSREMNAAAPIAFVAPVAPTRSSVRGNANEGSRPPGRSFERTVVARTAPPPVRAGFAAQQQQLAATPGKPLDDNARRQLKPAAAAPAPVVKMVAPAKVAVPTAQPPRAAPSNAPNPVPNSAPGKGGDRGNPDERKAPAPPSTSPVPAVPPPVAPPAEASRGQRGKADRGRDEQQRGQTPVAPPVATPPPPAAGQGRPPAAAAPAQAPQVAPTTPVPPAEQRGRGESRNRDEPRGPRAAPPTQVTPPQAVPPPPAAPSRAAPPETPQQPPEQRGRRDSRERGDREPVPPTPPQPRVSEPRVAPPPAAAPAAQPPQRQEPQRSAPPPNVPPPNAVPQAPPQPAAQKAEPRGQDRKPGPDKARDKKKDGDEQDRDEEKRKKRD